MIRLLHVLRLLLFVVGCQDWDCFNVASMLDTGDDDDCGMFSLRKKIEDSDNYVAMLGLSALEFEEARRRSHKEVTDSKRGGFCKKWRFCQGISGKFLASILSISWETMRLSLSFPYCFNFLRLELCSDDGGALEFAVLTFS
ncbi:hypothetical protein Tco_1030181 [Tanacetum coccineum]|uniref:Uncharacterized protein n=1 Tax=Tanacetum coccineum TaxID=301880 RepID=A0ABQ5G5H6_9ASTR